MAEFRDYDELLFAWQGWRNASGRELRNSYKRYVELANLAAKSNGKCLKIKHFLYEDLLQHGTAREKYFCEFNFQATFFKLIPSGNKH